MNTNKTTLTTLPLLLAALALTGVSTRAQMGPPAGPTAGLNAALTKVFGKTTAFTAKCEMRLLDKSEKEKMSMPMEFALLDGKFRVDVDMTQIKGQGMSEEAAAAMKQMNMERVTSIYRPDKKSVWIIYPGMQSYVNMPLPKEEAEALENEPKMEKTPLGKETVDGHPCEKSKVVLTSANGKQSEVLVWNATDLKDFPVQIQTTEKNDTVILRYRNVQFAKPDAKLFESPAGYTAYDSMQEFSAGMMQKMMGGMGKP